MPDRYGPRRTVLLPDMQFPDDLQAMYRQRGYWGDDTFPSLIRRWAHEYASYIALITPSESWDYATLVRQADSFAFHLAASGITPGDAVVLHHPNDVDFVIALLALLLLGAVPVLALSAHRQREIEHVVTLSDAAAYLGSDKSDIDLPTLTARCSSLRLVQQSSDARRFAAWPKAPGDTVGSVPVHPNDVALLLLSGGTTGLPKLIARTQADYIYNVRASTALCGITAQDRYLAALPMAHNFPLGCPGILGAFLYGAAVVLPESSAPEEAFEAIARHRATLTALVPSLATMWLDAAKWEHPNLSSLRLLQVGGAKLDASVAKRIAAEFQCKLQQVFGMAEGLLNFTRLDDCAEVVFETQGRPLCLHDELRIVDEEGQPVPEGQSGELLARGPYTIRGYYRAAEYNRQAFTADGFYRSGDRVRMRSDGYLVVEGRIKDVINRHGESIAADEIEACLRDHPAVRDAAVFPERRESDEIIHAAVISDDPSLALSDIRAFCAGLHLAPFKWPDRLSHVSRFPLTPIGKVDKRELHAHLTTDNRSP